MDKEFFESGSTKNSGRYWCKQARRRLLPDSINVLGCSCMDNRRESIKRYVFLNNSTASMDSEGEYLKGIRESALEYFGLLCSRQERLLQVKSAVVR